MLHHWRRRNNNEAILHQQSVQSHRDIWSSAIFLSPPIVVLQTVNTVDKVYNPCWMLWYLKRIRMVATIYVGVSGDNWIVFGYQQFSDKPLITWLYHIALFHGCERVVAGTGWHAYAWLWNSHGWDRVGHCSPWLHRQTYKTLLSPCRGLIYGKEGCFSSERVYDNREADYCMPAAMAQGDMHMVAARLGCERVMAGTGWHAYAWLWNSHGWDRVGHLSPWLHRQAYNKTLSPCRGLIYGKEGCLGSERVYDNQEHHIALFHGYILHQQSVKSHRDIWSSAIFLSPPIVVLQTVNTVDKVYNPCWMLWYLKRIRMVATIYVGVSGDNWIVFDCQQSSDKPLITCLYHIALFHRLNTYLIQCCSVDVTADSA